MANLADSFLVDLDELSDSEANLIDDKDADVAEMEEDGAGNIYDIVALNYDLDSVSKLQRTQRYIDIMQKVEDALQIGSDLSDSATTLEDDPEYQLIVGCNALSVDIENEIIIVHNFIRDSYRLKFPELESLVHHPIDYAYVVILINHFRIILVVIFFMHLQLFIYRYAITDVRKLANRMQFGVSEESSLDETDEQHCFPICGYLFVIFNKAMAWLRGTQCSVRQEAGSFVSRLYKVNLLLKLPKGLRRSIAEAADLRWD